MAPNAFNLSILLLMRKAYEKDVSIQERIEQFRTDHPDKTPLILVDLMHIDKLQHGQPKQNRYRNACGPNLAQLASIESVLQFLHRQQCRLVFFVAGPDNRDLQQDEHLNEFRTCPKDMRYDRDIGLIDALSAPNVNYREAVDRFGHIPTDRILFDSIVKVAMRCARWRWPDTSLIIRTRWPCWANSARFC
ncbi:uncharacterized protein LOC119769805 [Culex quinquefasciatus]|uniref:uncharacterized protein LOC119769805 n=1 Tax=Culex quinquefasciatus TaxID=7176 RepID=UPI0018E394A5|nr:uncharacterized protein LOC119769805 [Culex quinquefasciatus]